MDSYRAAHGYIAIAVANDNLFSRLASTINQPGLTGDPRFAADPQRLRHQAGLRVHIETWRGTKAWRGQDNANRPRAAGVDG
ncbi:CoA transferase [Acerihabitans arboris]|uniref:CoA transferase n=1 Tax=Acerihabitans arboris TaxID=2691583 RepID=UPI001FE5989D|nr:CoA transferase [Acerihabitans arboris]